MSITHQVTVWCDDCGDWDQATATVPQLRSELRKKGWTVVRHYNVRDYCPACSDKRKAALQEFEKMTSAEIEEYAKECTERSRKCKSDTEGKA